MKQVILVFFVLLSLLVVGCSSTKLPDLSKDEVASICNIDANQIDMTKKSNSLEYKITKSELSSQSLWIEVGPTSRKDFDAIKQIQSKNNLNDYPEVGDGAFIWTKQHVFRTMLVIDGKQTYRIYSIIDGCNTDEKIIEIANRIITSK